MATRIPGRPGAVRVVETRLATKGGLETWWFVHVLA